MEKTIQRSVSLDLLRTVSMAGVIGLHVFGSIFNANIDARLSLLIRIAYTLLYCSVNLFALLSGYLYLDKNVKTSSITKIWISTLFWCAVLTIISVIYIPGIGIKQIISYLLPYSADRLWYITCYTFCFFLIPFLNKCLSLFKKEELQRLLIILFILMSLITTFTIADRFHIVSNGYSGLWICYMFIWGGYLKKYGIKGTGLYMISIILCLNAFMLVTSSYLFELLFKTVDPDKILILYRYSSPFIVINSLLLFYIFVELVRIRNSRTVKWIFRLSAVSSGVYIIHAHPFILDHIIVFNTFKTILSHESFIVSFILLTAVVIAIYVLCGLAEFARQKLFQLLHMEKLSNWSANVIDFIVNFTIYIFFDRKQGTKNV